MHSKNQGTSRGAYSEMLLVLDSGPLGLLSNPTSTGLNQQARAWAESHLTEGDRFIVPEIVDYEVRRELLRASKHRGLERLDVLAAAFGYLPLTTAMMRDAAALWAHARNVGLPTAHDESLDCDVILAAQARNVPADDPAETVVVATTNTTHLGRYVDARRWTDI